MQSVAIRVAETNGKGRMKEWDEEKKKRGIEEWKSGVRRVGGGMLDVEPDYNEIKIR